MGPLPAQASASVVPEAAQVRARVLIVDDERSIRRTLAEFLREEGYEVAEAEDAEVALRRLGEAACDVVVTDIILPRITGVELLRRIHAASPEVQVVMMTGEPTVDTARDSLRAGASDYLYKPINKAAIQRVVAQAVRLKGLDDTRRRLEAENQAHRENLARLVEERTTRWQVSEKRANDLAQFSQATLDALTAHICVLDERGTILAVNASWRAFAAANPPTSVSASEGGNYFAVCERATGEGADLAGEVVEGLRAVARGEIREYACEYPCHAPEILRWFLLRATRFESGSAVRIVVAHSDVTERRLAQQELEDTQALYHSLVQNVPQHVFRKDRAGHFTFGNDSFCRSLGEPLAAIRGKTDADFFPAAVAAKYRHDDERVITTGEAFVGEEEHRQADGKTLWVSVIKTPLRDVCGKVVGLQGMSWDITQRKQTEEQLRKLVRAVEQSPVSIMIADRAGNLEFVNPKFTQVTGYTLEDVQGKNPRFLKSGETPRETYRQLWTTITAGGEWRGEFRNRRKDGTLFWELASISALRDSQGAITHFIAVKEDVTERKLAHARFLRAQRVESIGSLASGIAHDLNNILTPILMCAPMLTQEASPVGRQTLAQTIETSAQRAVGVVKQLLSFGRGKEGHRAAVQLRHLVRDMAKIARETFPRSIRVEEASPTQLWPVIADVTQIHQVLLNLCVNARDAMPGGGTLSLRAENVRLDEHFVAMHPEAKPGPYVRLQVADTGTGIPEAIQPHIFESFFTTKPEGEGTGLGLTTVQGIVRDHHGFLTFVTAPDRGTTFVVHLPAVPEETAKGAESRDPTPLRLGQGELVLVVDDEPAICETTRRSLEHRGYRVLDAPTGIAALAQFSSHPSQIRVVITDFMMPLMDGVTLCRALRVLAPDVPVIVSSGGLFGKAGREAQRAFEELGVRQLLHKPHTAEVLLRAVGEALDEIPRTADGPSAL